MIVVFIYFIITLGLCKIRYFKQMPVMCLYRSVELTESYRFNKVSSAKDKTWWYKGFTLG